MSVCRLCERANERTFFFPVPLASSIVPSVRFLADILYLISCICFCTKKAVAFVTVDSLIIAPILFPSLLLLNIFGIECIYLVWLFGRHTFVLVAACNSGFGPHHLLSLSLDVFCSATPLFSAAHFSTLSLITRVLCVCVSECFFRSLSLFFHFLLLLFGIWFCYFASLLVFTVGFSIVLCRVCYFVRHQSHCIVITVIADICSQCLMSFFWNNGAFYAIDDKTVGKEQKRTLKRKEGKKLTKSCFVQPDDEKKHHTFQCDRHYPLQRKLDK